jgi:hypothetical protein
MLRVFRHDTEEGIITAMPIYRAFALGPFRSSVCKSHAQRAYSHASALRKEYQQCVIDAVANQLKVAPRQTVSMTVEAGFQARATEEQAIVALLYSVGASATETTQTISNIKLGLKRIVREVETNPNRFIPAK